MNLLTVPRDKKEFALLVLNTRGSSPHQVSVTTLQTHVELPWVIHGVLFWSIEVKELRDRNVSLEILLTDDQRRKNGPLAIRINLGWGQVHGI